MNTKAVPIKWGPTLERLVVKLNPFCGIVAIKKEIDDGTMQAWEVFAEHISLGCFLTRIDNRYDGDKDLALLFTVREDNVREPITGVMYRLLEEIAREGKIKYIRIHVPSPALARIVENAGFNFLESVFIKEVSHDDKK